MHLPPLKIYKFTFSLLALDDMYLPEYKGSMFRGAFGWSFRNAVCVTKNPVCTNCIIQNQCSYFNVFETEIPQNDVWFLQGVKKIPHPFVIHPPLTKERNFEKGAIIKVGLTIFGSAINYLPFFVHTFQKMGERGISYKRSKFKVLNMVNNRDDETETLLFNIETGILKNDFKPVSIEPEINIEKVSLNFLTPFRVQNRGEILTDSAFVNAELLLSTIQRRYYALSKLFGEENDFEYPLLDEIKNVEVVENNLEIYRWHRLSNRQKTEIDMSGFVGSLSLAGDLKPYAEVLSVGEKINIGKNTVFGLGKYKMEINN